MCASFALHIFALRLFVGYLYTSNVVASTGIGVDKSLLDGASCCLNSDPEFGPQLISSQVRLSTLLKFTFVINLR